jgi:Uma2 family endonuclease
MATNLPRAILDIKYEEAAREYARKLPLEHYMEAIAQSTQRQITVESLELIKSRRPDLHVFSELLVQYPLPRRRKPGQIVPDNMVVLSHDAIRATTSFNLPLETARPFWVMEYVSKNNKRKDYEQSFQKYEQEPKVPYYLVFYPDDQDLSLFHMENGHYVSVKPNDAVRYALPELDLELGLLDGWIRYWWKGELLPLPAEMQDALNSALLEVREQKQRADLNEQTIRELQEKLARLEARKNGASSTE